ncbi:ras-GEF domain-containing family member 1B isoform X2 [Folsomia candida]|nr:ras-GEF domain-containing family member 1B isoform X2 [Folsomia candida]
MSSTSDESENSMCSISISVDNGSSTGSVINNNSVKSGVVVNNSSVPQTAATNNNNNNRGPYKPRDLFGVQLEVTSLLLEAELRKLATLQSELETSSQSLIIESDNNKREEHEEQQFELILAISRIQAQAEQLDREYKVHALGALKSAPLRGMGKSNRSQPAIGLKYLPKFRPSIFGTVASSPSPDFCYAANHQRKTLPQTPLTANGSLPATSILTNGSHPIEVAETMHPIAEENGRHRPQSSQSSSSSANGRTPCDWDNALVYQDTNLVSGTLDALIQHLVPTQSYYPDRAYVFAFLLSSRLYIRPHELLGRVFRLAMVTPSHSPKYQSLKEVKIVGHIIQLMGEWTELFPYDFRDERMMGHVRTITQKCVCVDPSIRKEVGNLLSSLLAKLTALERYEDFLHRINTEAALGEPGALSSVLTMCPSPSMLAQQLTHIELERLSKIGPEEFVQAFAKDSSQVEYKDMKKTRNLESYVQWFNRLSYYCASEICKMQKKKTRIRVIEYFIETARECFNIGNFNSLMAIIAGLNMSPVARMKKTWAKVNLSQLAVLEHQMDPSSNFTSYRSTLKAAVWRSAGATDERQRIVIPFFSLLVKDLYFLNEGCASQLGNGHINFDKFWQLAKQVTEVVAWQQIQCPFPKVQTVLTALQTAPVFGESALYLSSFECETAENAQEKERVKYLKSDGVNRISGTPPSTKEAKGSKSEKEKSHK